MKISVCIITKNEADNLERCLKSLKNIYDEIVVVDTGSVDNTLNVMNEHADIQGKFEWCDNFSKARNYCVSLASNDWIMVLDSDEWIEKADVKEIERIFSVRPEVIGRVRITNYYHKDGEAQAGQEQVCRFFNRKYHEYQGRIHEQLVKKDGSQPEIVNIPVEIGHSGYDGSDEDKRRKAKRNIELLLLDLQENGDEPYVLYQLGKSCYMQKEYEQSAQYFEKALWFDLEPKLEFVQDMIETYGYALLQLKRYNEMMFLENIYKEFAVSADYVFLMGLAYMNNGMFDKAIAEFEKATKYTTCKVKGCNDYKAYYNAGVICECMGRKNEAAHYYKKCTAYEPALEGLKRLNDTI